MSLLTSLHARGLVTGSVLILGALYSAGCGGGQGAAAPADSPANTGADTAPGAAAAPAGKSDAADDKAEPKTDAKDIKADKDAPAKADAKGDKDAPAKADAKGDKDAPAKADADPNAQREVTYVVVPDGLKISVAGTKFLTSAQAAQVGPGWGVKVSLEASADDGKAHSLLVPKHGPLAFAGSITRKGKSEPEHFGDERGGETDQAISDKPFKFSRTWPAAGLRPLAIGDSLDLQIAVWGLGPDKDSRRPVKQFCHVKMVVAKGKPRAVIEPPASAGSGK